MSTNKKTFDFGNTSYVSDSTLPIYKTFLSSKDFIPSDITSMTTTTTTNNTNYVFTIPSTYDGTVASSDFTITYIDPVPWNTSSVYTKQAGVISLVIFMCFLKDVIQFSKEQDIKLQELRIKTINDEILF